MGNELVVCDQHILIPPAAHGGFTELAKRASRLPQYFPPGAPGVQLATAIMAEANKRALANCTHESVVKTAFNAAVLGLVPGDFMGLCHFVPFKDRRRNVSECQLIVGFKGWLELAYDSGFLKDVHAEVVLQGETFDRWNDDTGPHVSHKLDWQHEDQLEWPNVIGAYCIWHTRAGGHGVKVVGRKVLEKLKRRGNVWDTDTIAMCLKTPIVRSSKTWRRTGRIGGASALEDAIDAEKPQPALYDDPIDVEPEKPKLDDFSDDTLNGDQAGDNDGQRDDDEGLFDD